MKLTNFPSNIPTAHQSLPYKRTNGRSFRRIRKTSRKVSQPKKGDLRPARAGAKRNPFASRRACRSVLAGRPGQRRCYPTAGRCKSLWLILQPADAKNIRCQRNLSCLLLSCLVEFACSLENRETSKVVLSVSSWLAFLRWPKPCFGLHVGTHHARRRLCIPGCARVRNQSLMGEG